MKELFKPRDLQYNVRNKNTLDIAKVRTTSYDIETVQYIGQKLWQMLLDFPMLVFQKRIKILHNQV